MSRVILISLVLFILSTRTTNAQSYVFDQGNNNSYYQPQVISRAQDLHYVYGVLTRGTENADFYSLEFTDLSPQVILELFVPAQEAYKSFRPSLVLADPNSRRLVGELPFSFPANIGGRVYPWQSFTETKVEEQGAFETVWTGTKLIKDFGEGRYLLAVFDPQGYGGRYVLKIGAKKGEAHIGDIFKKIQAFIRVKLLLY